MNIFILDESVERCAQSHCDKHVTKMIVEYAQILCTTHRYLDGSLYKAPSNSGKTFVKKWLLEDKEAEKTLFAAAYVNHPCTIWTRLASENYLYLYTLWKNLVREYYFRYRKIHGCYTALNKYLQHYPKKIMHRPGTEHPQCMPEEFKDKYYVHAYRKFYIGSKFKFAKWTKRPAPDWYTKAFTK
jgi:hypothetical protein